ncbi:hypothetical protein PBRA_008915 [Plasmodiophora brassicae]|uniref:FAD-binding PCMH-type domain-containing protein n=1 Tax=Plasmodiophora brassicae TaxID=37360 RepID=A0A0G4J4X1_PLABS|nr:hypothetical protein PBRA_008915 [Plasmodiophora brassicae]
MSARLLRAAAARRVLATSTVTVSRRTDLGTVTDADLAAFVGICGDDGVVRDADEVAAYNQDWLRKYKGSGQLVLRPSSTDQVSQILRYCNGRRLAVVPQGGNTGLVGGSVPVFDEIVLSLNRMNRIIEVDDASQVLVCEAGCVLETLDRHLAKSGFTMPLDLGAKGSCHIGGNLATNAGGIRLLRYGSLRGNVLGVEFVLADGTVVDTMSKLRKDNTGFDLKQLMIGSEGTLGVITKVAILVPRRPTTAQLAFVGVESFAKVLEVLKRTRGELGEILSAIEFEDRASFDMVLNHLPGAHDPLERSYPFYMLLEASGFCEESDSTRVGDLLSDLMDRSLIMDGTIAQDKAQFESLWKFRESITECLTKEGCVFKYDVSVPVTRMYDVVTDMRQRLSGVIDEQHVCGYGHLGDSNLHLNIVSQTYSPDVQRLIEPYVYEVTSSLKGSVSAEHGLGLMKANCIGYSKCAASIHAMQSIKSMFDPNGILNPYKVLPDPAHVTPNRIPLSAPLPPA